MSKAASPPKTNKRPQQNLISLTIKSKDEDKAYFKFGRDTPLKKLLTSYCDKKSQPYGSFPFVINGERFDHSKTPNQLGLEDKDEIDALFHVFGGGRDHKA